MMTTQGTAIRRRLAVRRTSHGPPWRGRKPGHRSIVAPLAASIAATVAATVAIRVGVSLARAERDRRSASAQRQRDRQFALLPGERVGDGLRRMALGQLDLAIDLLADDGKVPAEKAVHEIRKALKRLRALIRLLEDELGEQVYRSESAALREAGRRVASARDAEVILRTLDELIRRNPGKLAHRRGVTRLRARLAAERDSAAQRALGDRQTRAQVLGDLRAARGRVSRWNLSDADGIQAIEPALKRLYGQGARRHSRALRGKGDRAAAMHEWRKRVKDLRYAAEMLDRVDPDDGGGGARGKGGKRLRKRDRGRGKAGYLHRIARRADELGELLGDEHDLVLLDARVQAERGGGRKKDRIGRGTRRTLLKLIAKRRKRLRKQALRDGSRLYGRTPKGFVRRVRSAYARRERVSVSRG
jgi:CHAD domain-containing protein